MRFAKRVKSQGLGSTKIWYNRLNLAQVVCIGRSDEELMVWISLLAGVCVGVVLNWYADNVARVGGVRRPKCQACGRPRPAASWSAIIAYITRRHRCPACATPLSIRHVGVEAGTGALFAFCWLRTGANIQTLFNVLYGAVFILLLVTDLEHKLIPHAVTLPAITLAAVGAFVNPAWDSPKRALLGGGIGLLGTLLVYWLGGVFVRLVSSARGSEISEVAFGFGDVTLTTFIGLTVGAPDVIFAMIIGFLSGGAIAVAYLVVRGLIQRRYALFTAIPYGPFLILGGATMLYFGTEFAAWYYR